MAQFSYEQRAAQQAARRTNTGTGNTGPEVHFMGEYLSNDGDVAVVRFPYASMSDIKYETTHTVMDYPGNKFGKRIRCTGDGCELCKSGSKVETRFFAKAIVYVVDEKAGTVKLNNAVWDRAAAFADIDIKALMDEAREDFGTTLNNLLVKIKRSGTGQGTRYMCSLSLNNNKAVYNPNVYVADFTELDQVDPARLLSKSYEQYVAAKNPDAAPKATPIRETAPVVEETPVTASVTNTSAPAQTTTTEQPRRQTVYKF